jgi:homoserine dehydrogenase
MRVSILGLGNVGKGLLRILSDRGTSQKFREISGKDIEIVSVSDSTGTYLSEGLAPEKILDIKLQNNISRSLERMGMDGIFSMEPDVIVDLSPASKDGRRELGIYKKAFSMNISVVTANKSPLALHWKELNEARQGSESIFLHEATVAGGLPLFSLISGSVLPSEILEFRGVVSLTVNMVLSKMRTGSSFESAVKTCQEEGVAEADYKDDTDGVDAARKTVILANSIFGSSLSLKDLKFGGVKDAQSIEGWKDGRVKIVSTIRKENGELHVSSGPEMLLPGDPLLSLGEMSMGYTIKTNFSGTITVQSAKDGPIETASGVCNDLFLVGKEIVDKK